MRRQSSDRWREVVVRQSRPPATVVVLACVMASGGIAARRAAAEGTPLPPGASVCPGAVGTAGDVAVLNVTPVEATAAGFGAVRASDAPSNNSLGEAAVSNVNFRVGSVDPNVALVRIGTDGRVCFDNSPHATVQLVADQTDVLPPSARTAFLDQVDAGRGCQASVRAINAGGLGVGCFTAVVTPG